jgi:repressor LexA
MAEPLTPVERKVYHFLIDFLAENTFQPSVRDIGKRFRIRSTKTVADVLEAIARKGYIERDPSRSRGVRILGFAAAGRTRGVPVYERLLDAAGPPRPDGGARFITVDRGFLPGDDAFFVRARGDRLTGRGILDGDYVLVDPSVRARDGDSVACRLGTEVVVGALAHRGAAAVLATTGPEDSDLTVVPSDSFAELGVICGVFRPPRGARESAAEPRGEESRLERAGT